jgi:release factor glutamine methyltransferase
MRLIRLPGVHRPISDTWMLAEQMRAEIGAGRRRVLDVCTGTGALAIEAARAGADATAVDISRRSVASARVNAALHRVRVRTLRGDLFAPVRDRSFDLIVTNPPYVPGPSDQLPARGLERAWYAGTDGRALVDRICEEAAARLAPGGVLLLVHSSLNDERETLRRLSAAGLEASVAARHDGPLGPLFSARADELERRGVLAPGQRDEAVVIVRGERPEEWRPSAAGSRFRTWNYTQANT